MREVFVFEEIWGTCDGILTELGQPSKDDTTKVHEFKEAIDSLGKFPIVLRAPVDNHFAHLISRILKADWVNGLVLS